MKKSMPENEGGKFIWNSMVVFSFLFSFFYWRYDESSREDLEPRGLKLRLDQLLVSNCINTMRTICIWIFITEEFLYIVLYYGDDVKYFETLLTIIIGKIWKMYVKVTTFILFIFSKKYDAQTFIFQSCSHVGNEFIMSWENRKFNYL